MKRILFFALVLLLTTVSAIPVFAEAQSSMAEAPQGTFSLVGKITGIGDQTVTVKVWRGNPLVRAYKGQELTIQVNENTLFFFKQGTEIQPIEFSDLAIGQKVRVKGSTANDLWTASRITVTVAKFSMMGEITAIGDNTVTIKIWSWNTFAWFYQGENLTTQVNQNTQYFYMLETTNHPINFSNLAVGQRVQVKGRVANRVWTASRLTVIGAKYSLVGKITSIGDNMITVKVWRGNIFVRSLRGEELTITMTDTTRYLRKEGTLITEISFDDLEIGQKVKVTGFVADNVWNAFKVMVVIPQT